MLSILKKEQNTLFLLLIVFSLYSFVHNQLLYNSYGDLDPQFGISGQLFYGYPDWNVYNYKEGRAPFYIVNRWIRGIFHPVVATTILSWGYVFLSALALFIFLYRRFNSNTAFLGSLLFLFFPAIINHGRGPNYYSILAGLCFLWSLVFFQSAQLEKTKRKQALFYGVSGGFYALCFWVYIPYASFLPILLLIHMEKYPLPSFSSFRKSFKKWFRAFQIPFVWMIAGAVVLTVFFGIVNFLIYGRSFLFPLVYLKAFFYSIGFEIKPNLLFVSHMQFYLLVLILSLCWLGYYSFRKRKMFQETFLPLFYIYVSILYGLLELLRSYSILTHAHGTQPIIYAGFLVIGFSLFQWVSKRNFSLGQKVLFSGMACIVLVFTESIRPLLFSFIERPLWGVIGIFLALSLGLWALARYSRMREYATWKGVFIFGVLGTFLLFYTKWTELDLELAMELKIPAISYPAFWIVWIGLSFLVLLGRAHWVKVVGFVLLFSMGASFYLPLDSGQVRKDYYLAYLELSEYIENSILTEEEKKENLKDDLELIQYLDWGDFPFGLWHPDNRQLGRNIAGVSGIKAILLKQSELLSPDEQSLRVLKRIYNQIHGIVVVDVNDENTSNAFMSAYESIGIGMTKQAEFPYRRGEINWKITVLRFQKD